MQELFPICRSITGNGVRKTLRILKESRHSDASRDIMRQYD